jgi:hypothetical protein
MDIHIGSRAFGLRPWVDDNKGRTYTNEGEVGTWVYPEFSGVR